MTTVQVAVRIPHHQVEAIDRLIPRQHASRAEVIRRALELYLYRLECERDAEIYAALPLSDTELSLADDEATWKATPPW